MSRDRLNEIDKESIRAYIKGLSYDELEYLASCLPVDICHNAVADYIEKSRDFKNGIYGVMKEYNDRRY